MQAKANWEKFGWCVTSMTFRGWKVNFFFDFRSTNNRPQTAEESMGGVPPNPLHSQKKYVFLPLLAHFYMYACRYE